MRHLTMKSGSTLLQDSHIDFAFTGALTFSDMVTFLHRSLSQLVLDDACDESMSLLTRC